MSQSPRAFVAIDLGRQRVGIACSDPLGRIALPHAILRGDDRRALIDQLAALAHERDAEFVLGLPLELDGSERRPARNARAFARTLERVTGRLVHLQDETLTSVEAHELAAQSGRATTEPVDDLAAQRILESFLQSQLETQ